MSCVKISHVCEARASTHANTRKFAIYNFNGRAKPAAASIGHLFPFKQIADLYYFKLQRRRGIKQTPSRFRRFLAFFGMRVHIYI